MSFVDKDIVRLKHVIDACNKILEYVRVYIENGEQTNLLSEAIERNLIIIGEAARCVSDDLKAKNSKIPWQNIVGFRHILVHEYHHVDKEILWDIAENKIPELLGWVEEILKNLEKKQ